MINYFKQLSWFGRTVWLFVLFWFAVWAYGPNRYHLYQMCVNSGEKIYRTAEAEGYYYGFVEDCDSCWRYLHNTDYKFVEFQRTKRRREWNPIQEPGFYRVSRIERGSPDCHGPLNKHYDKYPGRNKEMLENNWCFKVERFERQQARYGHHVEYFGEQRRNPITGSAIHGRKMFVKDHLLDEIMAEMDTYSLNSFPFFKPSSFASSIHCNSFPKLIPLRNLHIAEVVKPTKDGDHDERNRECLSGGAAC